MELQPEHLRNTLAELHPLRHDDFEELYAVASDPLIWEQHPNPDRYKREVFTIFFEGAMASGGAFIIRDPLSGIAIGCTRFYDHFPEHCEVKIGYTFFDRACWGRSINPAVKSMMLEHAFLYVDQVIFHVGVNNIRSRKAMEKLGAVKMGEEDIAYHGERENRNVVYRILKGDRSA
jgi:RimJ/RimL family protein N-acetyltransferase